MSAKNIGNFSLRIETFGHDQSFRGSVFFNEEGTYSAQIDDSICKVSTSTSINKAVADAIAGITNME